MACPLAWPPSQGPQQALPSTAASARATVSVPPDVPTRLLIVLVIPPGAWNGAKRAPMQHPYVRSSQTLTVPRLVHRHGSHTAAWRLIPPFKTPCSRKASRGSSPDSVKLTCSGVISRSASVAWQAAHITSKIHPDGVQPTPGGGLTQYRPSPSAACGSPAATAPRPSIAHPAQQPGSLHVYPCVPMLTRA